MFQYTQTKMCPGILPVALHLYKKTVKINSIFTEILQNYNSFVPFTNKKGFIKTAIDRIFLLITHGFVFLQTSKKMKDK